MQSSTILSLVLVAALAGCSQETHSTSPSDTASDLGDYSRMAWADFVATTNRGITSLEQRTAELKAGAMRAGQRSAAEIDKAATDLSHRTSELRAKLAAAKEDTKTAGRSVRDDLSDAFSALKRDIEGAFR